LKSIFLVDVIFLGVVDRGIVEIHQRVPRVINAGCSF
jgi:hypothetical protein